MKVMNPYLRYVKYNAAMITSKNYEQLVIKK